MYLYIRWTFLPPFLSNAMQTDEVNLFYPACNCFPVTITAGLYCSLQISLTISHMIKGSANENTNHVTNM